MKFVLIPLFLFSLGFSQMAPANLCVCRLLPNLNVTNLKADLICDDADSCFCHEENNLNSCPAREEESPGSCPFVQIDMISNMVQNKNLIDETIVISLDIPSAKIWEQHNSDPNTTISNAKPKAMHTHAFLVKLTI
jgi:hypothetical protein